MASERPVSAVLTNPRSERVKSVRSLSGRSARQRLGRFLAEGPQCVREAVRFHHQSCTVRELYATEAAVGHCSQIIDDAERRGIPIRLISDAVSAAMSESVSTQGLLAVVNQLDRPLTEVLTATTRLVAVLAHVRDPGNAGTAVRVADAAGADAVVLSDSSVDIYNPKVVRSTAGSLFHLPIAVGVTVPGLVDVARAYGMTLLATDGGGDHDLDKMADEAQRCGADAVLRRPTVWLFGNEAWGLRPEDAALADLSVRIPIYGQAESLNLATAAAVCLYASARAMRSDRPAG